MRSCTLMAGCLDWRAHCPLFYPAASPLWPFKKGAITSKGRPFHGFWSVRTQEGYCLKWQHGQLSKARYGHKQRNQGPRQPITAGSPHPRNAQHSAKDRRKLVSAFPVSDSGAGHNRFHSIVFDDSSPAGHPNVSPAQEASAPSDSQRTETRAFTASS